MYNAVGHLRHVDVHTPFIQLQVLLPCLYKVFKEHFTVIKVPDNVASHRNIQEQSNFTMCYSRFLESKNFVHFQILAF